MAVCGYLHDHHATSCSKNNKEGATGERAGKQRVLAWVSDLVASITPEVKRLRAFKKIELQPGASSTVHFTISKADLSFINHDLKKVTEPGDFILEVGGITKGFAVVE